MLKVSNAFYSLDNGYFLEKKRRRVKEKPFKIFSNFHWSYIFLQMARWNFQRTQLFSSWDGPLFKFTCNRNRMCMCMRNSISINLYYQYCNIYNTGICKYYNTGNTSIVNITILVLPVLRPAASYYPRLFITCL